MAGLGGVFGAAVQDLGLANDPMTGKTQEEIDALKKKRKLMQAQGDAGMSPAVSALMNQNGNMY